MTRHSFTLSLLIEFNKRLSVESFYFCLFIINVLARDYGWNGASAAIAFCGDGR